MGNTNMNKNNNLVVIRVSIAFIVWFAAYWGISLLCDRVLLHVPEIVELVVQVIASYSIPLILVFPILRGMTKAQSGTPVVEPSVQNITKMFLIQSGFSVMALSAVTIILRVLNLDVAQTQDDSELIKQYPLIMMVLLLVFSPIVVEFLFRGLIFDRLVVLGTKKAILLSALFYSIPFLIFKGPSLFFYWFVLGLSFGYTKARTKKLWPCIVLNVLDSIYYRFLLALLYPLETTLSLMIFVFVYILAIPITAIVLVIVNRRKLVISP